MPQPGKSIFLPPVADRPAGQTDYNLLAAFLTAEAAGSWLPWPGSLTPGSLPPDVADALHKWRAMRQRGASGSSGTPAPAEPWLPHAAALRRGLLDMVARRVPDDDLVDFAELLSAVSGDSAGAGSWPPGEKSALAFSMLEVVEYLCQVGSMYGAVRLARQLSRVAAAAAPWHACFGEIGHAHR